MGDMVSLKKIKSKILFEKKLALMGLWLHARQDKWAHGFYNKRKHTDKSDNIEYDYRSYMDKKTKKHKYKKIKYKKLLKKNKRLKETIKNTKDYLKIAKAALKRKYNEDFKHNKYIGENKLNKRIDKYFHGIKYGFPLVVVDDKMRNKDVK